MFKLSYIKVCMQLVHTDLLIFKQQIWDKLIDVTIWVVLTLVVTGYILPFFGLASDFGVFQFAGLLAAVGLFELYGNVVDLVSDFQGNRVIQYAFTLPIPSWAAIFSKTTYYFIIYVILALMIFPVGKICLWYQFDLVQISYFKLVLAIFFQAVFYACFVLFPSSIVNTMSQMSTVWSRYIFPMWFLGGFQFSWLALYKTVPLLAYVNLCNPMIYITEAMRIALLGQEGYMNFWLCLLAIGLFSLIFLYLSLKNLKKKLDYV